LSFSSTDSFPQIPDASQLIVGLYELTITDTNSCSNSGSVLVEIKETPGQPELMYNYPLCIGDILELTDTNNYPNPPIFYYWTDPFGNTDTTNVGQFLINDASAGDYQLSISANGCISYVSDTQAVVYEIVPTGTDDAYYIEFRDSLIGIDISANDFPTANGFIIVLVDSAYGGQVVNNNNGTINYVPRSGFFGFDTITYAICDAFCPNSCDTIQVVIEVNAEFECYIPEGISPNGDGVNDILLINCKHEYPNAVLKVFSRWGTQVYEGAPQGWNGQFNGDDLPDGTYFYFLKLNDTTYTPGKEAGRNGDEYNGFIMIQR
jgi:gliding motility-associated-like protein